MGIINILDKQLESDNYSENILGLTTSQARENLQNLGANEIQQKNKTNPLSIFAGQFKDLLTMILLVCTFISTFMGEYIEAFAIGIIIILNGVLGFIQEYKTEKTLQNLKKLSAPTAKVYRDGKLTEILASEITVGDVICVSQGDKIPADAVVLNCIALNTEEAILTGESAEIEKTATNQQNIPNTLNSPNIIYMGTIVTKGSATAKVLSTGMETQMGKIAHMLNEIEAPKTPLQQKLSKLGKTLGLACLIICLVVTLIGVLRGEELFEMLVTGISLAVAAVPEGLPATVTISLALAVNRMVKQKALVKKLHAVETLGCANVICSDKTGTLTENKMTVKNVVTLDGEVDVTGNGFDVGGRFKQDGRIINTLNSKTISKLIQGAVLCNNSEIYTNENLNFGRNRAENSSVGSWKTMGNPTEIALLVMAAKSGIIKKDIEKDYKKLDEIPFDSKRKCMSVIISDNNNNKTMYTKGAYDILLEKCNYIYSQGQKITLTDKHKKYLFDQNESLANKGLRVLGFAFKDITTQTQKNEDNLIFVGLVGIIDPPRKQAKESVKLCKSAGIKTIMITGDHKTTACAIAKQIGIYSNGDIALTGKEIDTLSEESFMKQIKNVTVFARVTPQHKLKIVTSLKKLGNTVAMTGDGVNDAPAIKQADIGVSMGITGTDVTKESADIILIDDNFSTLVTSVKEGRVVYSNIRKFIRYLLGCNIGEVVTMFLGMLMGLPIVLLPIQILLINLVTDGLPAIALGLEPPETDIMKNKPTKQTDSIFANGLFTSIFFRGIIIGLTTLWVFITLYKQNGDLLLARTGGFFALVLAQLIFVFECKSEKKNIFTVNYLNNLKLILAVLISLFITLAVIYVPTLQLIFLTTNLTINNILLIVGCCLTIPVGLALVKYINNRAKQKQQIKI